jgi:hypothetical protein
VTSCRSEARRRSRDLELAAAVGADRNAAAIRDGDSFSVQVALDVDEMTKRASIALATAAPARGSRPDRFGEPEIRERRSAGEDLHVLALLAAGPWVARGVDGKRELRDVRSLGVEILLTPVLRTSSIRSTECSGRIGAFDAVELGLDALSEGSTTTAERSPKISSSTSTKPNRFP